MTTSQFNNAITLYCEHVKTEELNHRFIATIGGKNLLYSKTGIYKHNFEVAKNLGLTPIIKGFLCAEVEDIPSQFEHEQWEFPMMAKTIEGEIPPSAVEGQYNLVLYNSTFLAYSYAQPDSEQKIGFLNKSEDGTWGGFGESERQEFMRHLIKNQIIPV
jgi:hypothetical protein